MWSIPRSLTSLAFTVGILAGCIGHSFGQAAVVKRIASSTGEHGSAEIIPDSPSAFSDSESSVSEYVASSNDFANTGGRLLLTRVPADLRFHRFLARSFSPSALRCDLLDAGQAQFQKVLPEYGKGVVGFERRYGAVVAGHVANNFFNTYLFPALLHQEPRSPRLGPGASMWRRFGYAMSRVIKTQDDSGAQTFNSSLLLSTAAANAVANLYLPRTQRGLTPTFERIGSSLVGTAQDNLSREFLPDIQQFVLNHVSSRLRNLAHRLPFARNVALQ